MRRIVTALLAAAGGLLLLGGAGYFSGGGALACACQPMAAGVGLCALGCCRGGGAE